MNITLKGIPDKVHGTLKKAAQEQGRSLNAQVLEVLRAEVEEIERRRKMGRKWAEIRKRVASMAAMDDSVPLIREDREDH